MPKYIVLSIPNHTTSFETVKTSPLLDFDSALILAQKWKDEFSHSQIIISRSHLEIQEK